MVALAYPILSDNTKNNILLRRGAPEREDVPDDTVIGLLDEELHGIILPGRAVTSHPSAAYGARGRGATAGEKRPETEH